MTANDRFKRSFDHWLWSSMIAATALHLAAFALWPEMHVAQGLEPDAALERIELPPDVDIPEQPEPIQHPARPVITESAPLDDVTISPTTFEANPVGVLAPPPDRNSDEAARQPRFRPWDVPPKLLNEREVVTRLRVEYPPLLRDAGLGGTVMVGFLIDETGRVVETRIDRSSGHGSLDRAALRVADVMRFAPAQNRDRRITVWISLPVTFEVRTPERPSPSPRGPDGPDEEPVPDHVAHDPAGQIGTDGKA